MNLKVKGASRPQTGPTMLTVAEVAKLRGASVSAVKNACSDGTLTATKFGRAWAISAADAGAWVPRPDGWAKGRVRAKAPGRVR